MNEMNRSSFSLLISPLKRISPSRYFAMQLCPLKEILSSNRQQPLLPLSPSARLGSIAHRVLECAANGQVSDKSSFDSCWNSLIHNVESEMLQNQIEKHLVPLESSAPNYEIKKHMVLKLIQSMTAPIRNAVRETQKKSEFWVETKDGKVGGRIDLVVQNNGGVEIVDYKTGNVEDETGSGVLKQEYQIQMKLYAALYHEKYELWPSHLSLIGIDQKKHEVSFDQNECSGLLEQARKAIYETNKRISGGLEAADFANPSPSACTYCPYRPACSKYWESRKDNEEWPLDVKGEIIEKRILGNNTYRLVILNSGAKVIIRCLSFERNNFLKEDLRNVLFCDLHHDTSPGHYIEGLLTTGYVIKNGK